MRKQFGRTTHIRQGKIGRPHCIDGRSSVYAKSEHRQRQDRFPTGSPARCRGFGLFGLALRFRCVAHVHRPQMSEQKGSRRWIVLATAPLRGTHPTLPLEYGADEINSPLATQPSAVCRQPPAVTLPVRSAATQHRRTLWIIICTTVCDKSTIVGNCPSRSSLKRGTEALRCKEKPRPQLGAKGGPWGCVVRSDTAGPCCSDANGTALSDVDWETTKDDKHYRARIEGEWWDVPDEAVITERTGQGGPWFGRSISGSRRCGSRSAASWQGQ